MMINDMRLSDQHVYTWIRDRIEEGGGRARLIQSDMADALGCHRNTATRICRRLVAAGLIERVGGTHYHGYIYALRDGDEPRTRRA